MGRDGVEICTVFTRYGVLNTRYSPVHCEILVFVTFQGS